QVAGEPVPSQLDAHAAELEAEPGHDQVLAHLLTQLAELIERPASEVDVHAPLGAQDFDSLTAAEMHAEIEDAFAVSVPMAILFEGISLSDLARRVARARRLGESTLVAASSTIAAASAPTQTRVLSRHRDALPSLSLF